MFYAAANMQLPSDELYYWIADKCCYGLHCTKKSDAKSGAVHHLCSEVGKLVEAQMLADGHVAFRAKNGNGGGKEDVSEVEEENGNGAGVADVSSQYFILCQREANTVSIFLFSLFCRQRRSDPTPPFSTRSGPVEPRTTLL